MKKGIRKYVLLLSISALLLSVSACAPTPGAAVTPSPSSSQTVAPTPSASADPTSTPTPTPIPSQSPSPAPSAAEIPTGIFGDSISKAEKLLSSMTPEEKAGQLFLARYPGPDAPKTVMSLKPAGFILFGADFENKTLPQVKSMIQSCQKVSPIPLLIGVDEEGGTVVRVSRNKLLVPKPYLSPQALYKQGGMDAIILDAHNKSKLLLSLGINLNLAPVADVSVNKTDFINARAFGKPAAQTSEYVRSVVHAMKTENLSCTLKHFPGYGNNADTHTGSAVDQRPLKTFTDSDFLPFTAGIEEGAQSILVSHLTVKSMDPSLPASLSKHVHEILRKDLGFSGVIMTDDLGMDAVKLAAGDASPAVLAVLAGNDFMITSDFEKNYDAVLAAIKDGRITQKTVDAAVLRTLAWKYHMGILQ